MGKPWRTNMLCTGPSSKLGALKWSPPMPIEIEGGFGALAGAELPSATTKYGLGIDAKGNSSTDEQLAALQLVARRNYEPSEWRINGAVIGQLSFRGYKETPGDFQEGEPILGFDVPGLFRLETEIDFTSGSGGFPRPDFTRLPRFIADFQCFSAEYPITGFHPICRDEETGDTFGGWCIVRVEYRVRLHPYMWRHEGRYLLDQDVSVNFATFLRTGVTLDSPEAFLDESVEVGGPGSALANMATAFDPVEIGGITVRDPLVPGVDDFGSITLHAFPTDLDFSASLAMTCAAHYLPSPDL